MLFRIHSFDIEISRLRAFTPVEITSDITTIVQKYEGLRSKQRITGLFIVFQDEIYRNAAWRKCCYTLIVQTSEAEAIYSNNFGSCGLDRGCATGPVGISGYFVLVRTRVERIFCQTSTREAE